MIKTIGMIETISVIRGIEVTDAMLKAAKVELVFARPVCTGKWLVMVEGDVGAVKTSIEAGVEVAGEFLQDRLVIPQIHPQVIPALSAVGQLGKGPALGAVETFTVSSGVRAADAAAKMADIDLLEVRMAIALGGKCYLLFTGEVSAVSAAVEAASSQARNEGLLVSTILIPNPRPELIEALSGPALLIL